MVEPRSSVVNKEEVNADNWETNIGIIEGEGDGSGSITADSERD